MKSVEIRDVAIPVALQDAMSRQAQAEREKQARVILGSAEAEIAGKFVEAADDLCGPARGAAAPRHEHHLRDHQGARHDDPDADLDGRQHEPSRGLGFGWAGQGRAGQCNWIAAAEQPLHAAEKRFQSRRDFTCRPANMTRSWKGPLVNVP